MGFSTFPFAVRLDTKERKVNLGCGFLMKTRFESGSIFFLLESVINEPLWLFGDSVWKVGLERDKVHGLVVRALNEDLGHWSSVSDPSTDQ